MPQVALGGIVDVDGYLEKLYKQECKPMWYRYIDHMWNLKKVPGFAEALRDNFIGWNLHHIAGEMARPAELLEKGLYWKQPWWALRFVTVLEHRKIHAPQMVEHFYEKRKNHTAHINR